jgi:hypothetical protein
VFFGGAAGLRSYITFIVHQSHAYGTLAGPIAALLFLFVLALGVLLGAEFNAAIEWMWPSPERRPRALHPRRWKWLEKEQPSTGPEPIAQSADPPWPPDPIVRAADPIARPAEPKAQRANPTRQPADPNARRAQPNAPPTDPQPVDPTAPAAGPTAPLAGPTAPLARPTAPPTGPNAPPTGPNAQPAAPIRQPADSVTRPVDPTRPPAG